MDRCADCGGIEIVSNAEDFVVDGKPFLQRSGYCNECGWGYSYTSPLRQFTANQRARGIGPPLPKHPGDDTVPMLDPFDDTVPMLDPDAEAEVKHG